MNKQYREEETQKGNKHVSRYSHELVIREPKTK